MQPKTNIDENKGRIQVQWKLLKVITDIVIIWSMRSICQSLKSLLMKHYINGSGSIRETLIETVL
jgi:hypothetical protein